MRLILIKNEPYSMMNHKGEHDPLHGTVKYDMNPVPWFTLGKSYEADECGSGKNQNIFAFDGQVVLRQDDMVSDLADDDCWLLKTLSPGHFQLQGFLGVEFKLCD